ncbi:MAG: pyridoxal phosphate-dependent aminotransferase [Puniceicoccales bacterium]|jgi:aspartate/methionine/tyrosine aminotransferase|nr:pyridoxal phosphate-dependent aminotransferase [Puniceicoccales bacterium]
MFTQRFVWTLENNALAQALSERRAAGAPVIDLTESNPARVGFAWEPEVLGAMMASASNCHHEADPRGLPLARRAVADYYRGHGVAVAPEQIHLAASTSEGYGWLLKLLTDPGDNVLVPVPSYPLLGFLAALECVSVVPYPLSHDGAGGGWHVDVRALEDAVTPRTRAIFCVTPNNPTGSVLSAADREALRCVALRHGLALVVDEVFLDFGADGRPVASWAGETRAPLFVLSGLSKVALLPQLKLGWVVTAGPPQWRGDALARLDFVADTYLSVNAPVQNAAAALLGRAPVLRAALLRRIGANELALRAWCAAGGHGVRVPARQAGWHALVALPRGVDEERLALDLARRDGVGVHPGYFYDIPGCMGPHCVVSLIVREAELAVALRALDAALRRH